tara:strand:+ start:127 stop:333 length:207 start_codon:yes stop_codon:yes gene_type:complete
MAASSHINQLRVLKAKSNAQLNKFEAETATLIETAPLSKVQHYVEQQRRINERTGQEIAKLSKLLKVE